MPKLGHACAEVPLEPLREAFERSCMTTARVARIAGLDHSYVRRLLLGVPTQKSVKLPTGERRYYFSRARSCGYETAVRLAAALGIDPHEVGV